MPACEQKGDDGSSAGTADTVDQVDSVASQGLHKVCGVRAADVACAGGLGQDRHLEVEGDQRKAKRRDPVRTSWLTGADTAAAQEVAARSP